MKKRRQEEGRMKARTLEEARMMAAAAAAAAFPQPQWEAVQQRQVLVWLVLWLRLRERCPFRPQTPFSR